MGAALTAETAEYRVGWGHNIKYSGDNRTVNSIHYFISNYIQLLWFCESWTRTPCG